MVNVQIDRVHCKPWGLEGGLDAAGNEVGLRVDGQWKTDYANAKVFFDRIKGGDAYSIRSGGGGGHGAPWQRALDAVRHDVRQGYVTLEAAAAIYGVVLDPSTLAVDQAATDAKRAALRNA